MKQIKLLAITMLITNFLVAQNPFAKLGYTKVKVATMSKGRYNEFFDTDTLMQIGTTIINTNTGKIHSFVSKDDTTNIMPEPQISSTWTSPDPLAEKYWSISPYAYCAGNPIRYTDPTGMLIDDYGINENGDVKLINKTDDNFDRLYAVDENGNKKDISGDGNVTDADALKVNDQTILPQLEIDKLTVGTSPVKINFAISKNSKEIHNVALFASFYTSKEWGLKGYLTNGFYPTKENKEFFLGTLHEERRSPSINNIGKSNPLFEDYHSHVRIDGRFGFSGNDMLSNDNIYNIYQERGYRPPKNFLYDKEFNTFYIWVKPNDIESPQNIPIKRIYNPYKFLFGK
jgi:hypothetical protein